MWRSITLIANICVNIVLLITYAQFFGQHSIRKYLEGNIIVVTNEERKSIITAPGKIFIKYSRHDSHSSFDISLKAYLDQFNLPLQL